MKSGFATDIDAINYLRGEYHGAAAAGDNQLALELDASYLARLIREAGEFWLSENERE